MARTPRKYFNDEQRLVQWNNFDLTTHRVVKDDAATGTSSSILLRAVTGTSVTWSHQPMYLVLAALVGLSTQIVSGAPAVWSAGCIVAIVVFVAAYFKSRSLRVVIMGPGAELRQELRDTGEKVAARQFVDLVDEMASLAARHPERLPTVVSQDDAAMAR